MAGMNLPMQRSMGQRVGDGGMHRPRFMMSWEDWLTLSAALICFITIAFSIQQAKWVDNMPAVVPTAIAGLVVGLFAARIRLTPLVVHPVAIAIGLTIVILSAQQFAEGATLSERLADFRLRMNEWWAVVRANDISNDNLPFVTLVHGITFLAGYVGAWSLFRWHNAWLAIVPGGVVLLANISFLDGQPSAAFIVFLFGAIILIARMHLQKNQARWRRSNVEYPDFVSLTSLQVTIWIALALIILAWLVPLGKQASAVESVFDTVVKPATDRSESLARLFHNVDSRKGAKLHNFGSILPIQGSVKLGTKPVLEVQSAEQGLIRATSYDEYTGTGWKATDRDTARVEAREVENVETNTDYLKRTVTVLRVKILDSESTILTYGTPLTTNVNTLVDTPDGFNGDIERIRSRVSLDPDDAYTSFGSISTATQEELTAAGEAYPEWVAERYLQLPDDMPEIVAAETNRIITEAGATTPYDKAKAIELFLREYPYDLSVEAAPPGEDSVGFFLDQLRRGYFDYHASAMTVMLREAGIPARLAVGYALDSTDKVDTTYTVKKDDAYSWVEVFFPQYGWITFNPTPDKGAGGAGGIGGGTPIGLETEGVPTTEIGEFETYLDPGLEMPPEGIFGEALAEEPTIAGDPLVPTWAWYVLAAMAAVIVAGFVSARVAWNWGLGGLEGRVRLWAKAQRAANWAGLGSSRDETPREWSARLGSAVGRESEALTLASAYEEARYGRPEDKKLDDAEVESAYKRLRSTLMRVLFRRQRPEIPASKQ